MCRLHILLLVTALTGCSSINTKDVLITPNQEYFTNSSSFSESQNKARMYPNLLIAYNQIKGTGYYTEKRNILSEHLAKDPLVQKLVIISKIELIDGKKSSEDISEDDIQGFTKMLRTNYGPSGLLESGNQIDEVIKSYLKIYYSDDKGFVDRNGVVYKMSEITTSIGNDTISAVAKIVLEGIYDALLKNPVYANSVCSEKEGNKTCSNIYLTAGGKEPSAYRLGYVGAVEVTMSEPDPTKGVITEENVKKIRYLSGIAGDQSKILSGMLVRELGGFEISFVIGAHFSFGDNDTFAALMDAIFEVSSKRLTEVYSYKYLGGGDDNTIATIQKLAPINDEGPSGGGTPREHPKGPNCFRDC